MIYPPLIITGAYGSGKTEVAMELAVRWAEREAVTLIDLDFVNPYFRSQDHRAELEQHGVHIIAPDEKVAAIDADVYDVANGTNGLAKLQTRVFVGVQRTNTLEIEDV
jgi:Mrp family chromosome partitioning ATPase